MGFHPELKSLPLVVEGLLNLKIEDPNELLLNGRRAIEFLKEVELLKDLCWDPMLQKWVLFCSIDVDILPNEYINKRTFWYILIDPEYPQGKIDFYPAIQEGIQVTYPHQNYNTTYSDDRPWRKGKLCLDTSVKVLGRYGDHIEPKDAPSRLYWHFSRAVHWIELASKNELLSPGDPYELPAFPSESIEKISFSESPTSFQKWQDLKQTHGIVEFSKLKNDPEIWITKKYLMKNNDSYQPKWGTTISNLEGHVKKGVWVMLSKVPTMTPWQIPFTWGELQSILLIQGINLMDIIKNKAHLFRDGNHHFIFLGFPIPETFGEKAMVINWQAIKLPILSYGNLFAKGFRKGEAGYWHRDRTQLFRKNDKIDWIDTENWNRNEILNRGRFDSSISQCSILQIGAGSLGSMVAEQLVRADLQKLQIVDSDVLQAGNLMRHTLDMRFLEKNKAMSLSRKLNDSVPHSKVEGIMGRFPTEDIDYANYRVILDCTGEDDVIYKLHTLSLNSPKIFISVSLGYAAKRLFFYTHRTMNFSANTFFNMLNPWIEKEKNSYSENDLPRDGIGCWHPVFPARIDDVSLMSAIVVKGIEHYILNPASRPTLLVYEQRSDGDMFSGVELVHKEEWNE